MQIDTLKAARILIGAGFKDDQARALVEALVVPLSARGVTKDHLDEKLDALEDRLALRLAALEQRMIVKVGVMLAAALGLLLALEKALGL